MKKLQLISPIGNKKLYRFPAGVITQLYGENPELYKQLNMNGHNGWDIVGNYDSPLYAACAGRVVAVKKSEGQGGNEIAIRSYDKSIIIMYAHCNQILVKPGDGVAPRDVIGTMGNSGFVVSGGVPYWGGSNPDKKGTHLHFGIKELGDVTNGTERQYSDVGETLYIKNYNNGFNGAVNPLPYFEDEITGEVSLLISKIIAFLKGRIKK